MMRRVFIQLGACLALALPLTGCSSSKSGTDGADSDAAPAGLGTASTMTTLPQEIGPVDPALDSLTPNVFANRRPDSTFYIGFAAGATGRSSSPGMATLRGIHAMSAVIYGPDNRRLDSLWTNEVTFSGITQGDDDVSVTGSGAVTWRPATPPVGGTFAIVTLFGQKGVVNRRIEIVRVPFRKGATEARSPLSLSLEVNERGPVVELVLKVKRVAPAPEGEYLPSAERFRIEIRNEANETIWSSSSNRGFAQVIGPVEPIEVGGEVEYRAMWDGRSDIDHAAAPAGTYRIVATIPAKPKPYVLREELTRSGR